MNKGSLATILIFGLFWTALVGTFDCFIGSSLYHQTRAKGFPQTTGTIISSEVTRHRGSKGGTTYGVSIEYTYQVNGVQFAGNRYRYGAASTSDSKWAHDAVQNNPVGAEVPVYYDPTSPSESLLSPGIGGSDAFLLLFLTPFNMVMLGLWAAAVGALNQKRRALEAGGAKWSEDGRFIRICLPRFSPVISGMVTAGVGSFVSIFVIGFSTGFHPTLQVVLGVWGILLAAAASITIWQWRKQANGSADLVINPLEQTVELPASFGRKQRQTVPFSAVNDITVETIAHRGSKGGTSYTYAVTLQNRGNAEKLTDWYDENRAQSLAGWLRERIKPDEPAAPPRKVRM